MARCGLAALLAAGLVGCATTTPESSFYVLSVGEPVVLTRTAPLNLSIGPIDLPRYLDRPQIVSRAGDSRLEVDEFHRWGGALDEEMSRVLVSQLAGSLLTDRVFSYPSRLSADSDYRVALDVQGFDGARGGTVTLSLAWSLIDDRSGKVLRTERATYTANVAGEEVEVYVMAMSRALAAFGNDLARALHSLAARP
jgi:uncharacterized lipoprotein YmbA